MMAGAKIFASDQLCSQQIWKHGQTADKSIWTETPWVQLWKATKCTKHHVLMLQLAERHSRCSTQRKAVELLFRRVLQLTHALSLVPILVKLIFAIGALLVCNRWMSERKPSLLSRAPTLPELSHSRQAVNMSQDTCRSLQPTSTLGTERLLSSSSKHSPTPSYSISWNIHTPNVLLNSPGILKYLGYLCMIQSVASLIPHTCSSSTGASCGMQGQHRRWCSDLPALLASEGWLIGTKQWKTDDCRKGCLQPLFPWRLLTAARAEPLRNSSSTAS